MTANVRFLQNNLAAADAAAITVSSAASGFGGDNSVDSRRWKKWRPAGAFKVTSANKKIYISDGSDKTITLTEATYATGALLAAHVTTQLNASSSLWTCSYNTTTGKFSIGRSSATRSLRLTQTTDAAWSMLGFTGVADFDPGTATAADVRRNHTSETWRVDLGSAVSVSAFLAIGPAGEDFILSDSATVTLKASNVNDFDTPDATYTLAVTRWGIVEFFDAVSYRYWQYELTDLTNTSGATLDHAQIYLGDYVEPTDRNINIGFQRELVDPSVRSESDGGSLYWRQKTKYWLYSAIDLEWLADDTREDLERIMGELGTTTPFFISLDPEGSISDGLEEFTKYVVLDQAPGITHQLYKYHTMTMTLREVI